MALAPGVNINDLDPSARNALLTATAELDKSGVPYTITSGARSYTTQQILRKRYEDRGFTGLPAAQAGSSNHEKGLAVDISISPDRRDAANQILAKHGFQWFGPQDHVHYDFKGGSVQDITDLSFLNTGAPAPPTTPAVPTHDLSFLNTAAPKPARVKATKPPDLSFLNTGAATPAPAHDLSFLSTGQPAAALPPPRGPAPPGALSAPAGAGQVPGSPFYTPPTVAAEQNRQAQQNLQIPQRALNAVNTPITIGSVLLNNAAREIGKRVQAGGGRSLLSPNDMAGAVADAARNTSWSKLLVSSLKGKTAAFPELVHSYSEGAPQTTVGKYWLQHPAATTALDFLISFPVTAAMGEAQNAGVGLLSRGLGMAGRATGATEAILNKFPAVRTMIENNNHAEAATELLNKSIASTQHYLRDTDKIAEDARVTSQKYLRSGAPIATVSPVTGQKVNKLEELVADYMDAGNPGSKHEALHPPPEVVARDRAVADRLYAILQQTKTARAAVDAGTTDANALLERLLQSARTAGREAAQTAVAAGPASSEAVAAERAQSVLGRVGQGAATAGRKVVNRAEAPAVGSRWHAPDGSTLEVMDRSALEAAGANIQPGHLPLLVIEAGKSGLTPGEHLVASPGALPREYSQIPATGEPAALSLRGEADWSKSAREMLAEANSPLPSLPAAAPLTNARAIKAKIDAIEAKAKEALAGIVSRSRSAAVSTYTEQKAGQAAASAATAAERGPLNAILQRARETGPGVIRAQSYNDLGRAAEGANRAAQRTRELGTVAEEAASHGIDFADVQRLGDGYSRIFDGLAKQMVDMGLLQPEAAARLKGQYLPRLYLLTKGNPGDVSAFLKFLDSEGMLTPEAVAEANKRGLTSQWRQGLGPKTFTKSRELTNFAERNAPEFARAMVPEATPAALHGIEAQTRAVGLGHGMAEIAKNPEWVVPLENGIPPAGKEHWIPFRGKGPLEGTAVHPAIHAVLEAQTAPNKFRQAAVVLFGDAGANRVLSFNQGMRKAMLAGPGTMANIIVGHGWFAHAEAAMSGTRFGPLEWLKARRSLQAFERTGTTADQYLNEALNSTDLLIKGNSILPKAAKRVSGGVGLETPLQNVGRQVKKLGGTYLGFTHDALAAGKFGLYKQLRLKGLSVDEAARRTRWATINYTRLPGPIRLLDQGMIAPFITFLYRGSKLTGKMALNRPDIFATASGHRFTYFLDQMADRLAVSRGQQPEAVAARQSGHIGPTTFPVPGQRDEHGRQIYKQEPLLAPLLHHFTHAGSQDLTEPLRRQAAGTLPLLTVPYQFSQNIDVRGPQPRPIVSEGLPPGSGAEANKERARWLLGALAPPLAGLLRINDARLGVTPFPAAGKKPQTLGQATEQFFTSARTGTADELQGLAEAPPGEGISESHSTQVLQQMRRAGGEHYGQFALDHYEHLINQRGQDPAFTPVASYAERARALTVPELLTKLDAVMKSLKSITYGEHYTGAEREKTIGHLIDWGYTLMHEQERRKMRPAYQKFAAVIARPLAEMRNLP